MSTSYSSPQRSPTYGSYPVVVPTSSKAATLSPYSYGVQPYHQPAAYPKISTSPPERAESLTTGGGTFSTTGSSYAGSESDSSAVAGVDLLDYLHDRFSTTIDSTPLDRSLATQAQTSGALNAKTRELLALQALAKSRLAATKANFADGIRAAKDVQKDLEWTQKRVTALNHRAAQKYPTQYRVAAAKYPAPIEF